MADDAAAEAGGLRTGSGVDAPRPAHVGRYDAWQPNPSNVRNAARRAAWEAREAAAAAADAPRAPRPPKRPREGADGGGSGPKRRAAYGTGPSAAECASASLPTADDAAFAALVIAGDWAAATRLLRAMAARGAAVGTAGVRALMEAHAAHRMWPAAAALGAAAAAAGVAMIPPTWCTLIRAHGRARDWPAAVAAFKALPHLPTPVTHTVFTHNALLGAANDSGQAFHIVEKLRFGMARAGIPPDDATLALTSTAAARAGRPDVLRELWRDAVAAAAAGGRKVTAETFGVIVAACGRAGAWRTAAALHAALGPVFRRLRGVVITDSGIRDYGNDDLGPAGHGPLRATGTTHAALVAACAAAGNWRAVFGAYGRLVRSGLPPCRGARLAVCAAVAACGDGPGAAAVFRAAVATRAVMPKPVISHSGVPSPPGVPEPDTTLEPPTPAECAAYLASLATCRWPAARDRESRAVLALMRRLGTRPDAACYAAAMHAAAAAAAQGPPDAPPPETDDDVTLAAPLPPFPGAVATARAYLAEMRAAGIAQTAATADAAVACAWAEGDRDLATRWLHESLDAGLFFSRAHCTKTTARTVDYRRALVPGSHLDPRQLDVHGLPPTSAIVALRNWLLWWRTERGRPLEGNRWGNGGGGCDRPNMLWGSNRRLQVITGYGSEATRAAAAAKYAQGASERHLFAVGGADAVAAAAEAAAAAAAAAEMDEADAAEAIEGSEGQALGWTALVRDLGLSPGDATWLIDTAAAAAAPAPSGKWAVKNRILATEPPLRAAIATVLLGRAGAAGFGRAIKFTMPPSGPQAGVIGLWLDNLLARCDDAEQPLLL